MRIKYSLYELSTLYEKLVQKAYTYFENSSYDDCIKCVEHAAHFQYFLNNIYSDYRLDLLIRRVSQNFFHVKKEYKGKDTVFFYDSFCLDNRGLTQHYLDALISSGKYKVVYICEKPSVPLESDTVNMLKDNYVDYYFLPDISWKEKCEYLHCLISKYSPKAALFHLTPYTTIPFIAFLPFPQIVKYQINLTDHAFWLGGNFFDYLYEFRSYGVTLSIEKRGYKEQQLILNSFYPWQSKESFKGFPASIEGKVVVFSGGAMYKIEGENGIYFTLVKSILDTYPNVIFFYAGEGNDVPIRNFIKENAYEERLLLLGNRKDIDAVFKNCDIYMSTYPFGGGLMSQYAAINSKPILVYKSTDIEKLACTKQYIPYALNTIQEFIDEAGLLINNETYRKERGDFFKSLIINQETFRARFHETFMNSYIENVDYCFEKIDYSGLCHGYVDRINNNAFGLIERRFILNKIFTLKVILNSLLYLPTFLYNTVERLINFCKKKLCKLNLSDF